MPTGKLKAGKKRYSIALQQDQYDRLVSILKEFGSPVGTSAAILDQYIAATVVVLEHLKKVAKEEGRLPKYSDALSAVAKVEELGILD